MSNLYKDILNLITDEIIERLKNDEIIVQVAEMKDGAISTYFDWSYEIYVVAKDEPTQTVLSFYLRESTIIVGILFLHGLPGYRAFTLCDPHVLDDVYTYLQQCIKS